MTAPTAEHAPTDSQQKKHRAIVSFTGIVIVILLIFSILSARHVFDVHTSYNIRTTATLAASGNNAAVPWNETKRDDTCNLNTILNPVPGVVDITCNCYGGASISSDLLTQAADAYCDSIGETTWGGDVGWTQQKTDGYWYTNSLGSLSVVLIVQTWWADQLGNQGMCGPEFTVSVDQCKASLAVDAGGCGGNGAQGHDACLLWTLDPDPEHNNPEIYSQLPKPSGAAKLRSVKRMVGVGWTG